MKKFSFLLIIVVLSILVVGCSSASVGRTFDYGTPKLIVSNGGACVNLVGISEGRVEDVANSDGWVFTDYRTGELVQVGGDVIIKDASQSQVNAYSSPEGEAQATADLLQQIQDDGTIVVQSSQCN